MDTIWLTDTNPPQTLLLVPETVQVFVQEETVLLAPVPDPPALLSQDAALILLDTSRADGP